MRLRITLTVLLLTVALLGITSRSEGRFADQAIHIKSDGSVDPPSSPIVTTDNVTYQFAGDVSTPLSVERDNIIVEGANHTVDDSSAFGVHGVNVIGRSNVTIKDLEVAEFWQGIYIESSSNITIKDCIVRDHYDGIVFTSSANCTVETNNVTWNYNDAVYFTNCSNVNVSHNHIRGSDLTTHDYGVTLYLSSNGIVFDNQISYIEFGIGVQNSLNVNVFDNNVTRVDEYALWLEASTNNTFSGNSVIANSLGVWLSSSSGNMFYRNSFINNTVQVQTQGTVNDWNSSYLAGGNFWSDYTGIDAKSGQFQNQTGSDGIGDTPYLIDANNQDHYPLMQVVPEYPSALIVALFLILPATILVLTSKNKGKRTSMIRKSSN